jgi:alkanesulfonate monooxygenase SsuD/methylene tetrahydromethanopterin reductase-like flavin-dependent oxidoreductase (luciferase family)
MFTMRFDMRARQGGVPRPDLYTAALDMCAWAEGHRCLAVVICEHHCSEDGYLPTPLLLGSAVAARTNQLQINHVVLLPLYDPVRLAEEMSVLDIISNGRASYVFGLGYRAEEYNQFGLDIRARGRLADEKLDLLRRLLTGEPVTHEGRHIFVSPSPHTPGGPLMFWGGGSLAAARRAGRYGLGFLAQTNLPGMQEEYEKSCRQHGHAPGATLLPPRDTVSASFVAEDVDEAWAELGDYLLHDTRAYAEWNPGNETSAHISPADTVDQLRQSYSSHRVFNIDEAVAYIREGNMLNLVPLCGGIPPQIAWKYLEHAGRAIELLTGQPLSDSPDAQLGQALQQMLPTPAHERA